VGVDPGYYYKTGPGQYPDLFEEQGHIFSVILEPLIDNADKRYSRTELIRITALSHNYPEGTSLKLNGNQSAIVNGIRMDVSYQDTDEDWFVNIYFPKSKRRISLSMASLARWQVKDTLSDTYCGQRYLTRTSPVKFDNGDMGAALLFWSPESAREAAGVTGFEAGWDITFLEPTYVFITLDGQGRQLNDWKRLGDTKCGLYWDSTRHLFLPRSG
jgi:hypothetical protein